MFEGILTTQCKATDDEVSSVIGKWLTNATQRKGEVAEQNP